MYEHTIAQMGLSAAETCFIDDSMANLEGAARHGITRIMMNRDNYPRVLQQNKCFPKAVEQSKYTRIRGLDEFMSVRSNMNFP
jgi:FMN phosphatase YigB (HAD superfamily)